MEDVEQVKKVYKTEISGLLSLYLCLQMEHIYFFL